MRREKRGESSLRDQFSDEDIPKETEKGQTSIEESPKDRKKSKSSKEESSRDERKGKTSQEDPPKETQGKSPRKGGQITTPVEDPHEGPNPREVKQRKAKAKANEKIKQAKQPATDSSKDKHYHFSDVSSSDGPSQDSTDSEDLAGNRDAYLDIMPSVARRGPRKKKEGVRIPPISFSFPVINLLTTGW